MKKFIRYIYIVVFAFLISTIGVLSVLKVEVISEDEFVKVEKRKPAVKPHWSWEINAIKTYFPQMESFVNDNFSFRSELVGMKSKIGLMLGMSNFSEKVVIGKNGFLFLGNAHDRVIDQVRGKKKFSKKKLSDWQKAFQQKKEYLLKKGIPLYIAIAPNKHSIYPEYLPDNIKPSSTNELQQIIGSNVGLDIINLEDALLREKKKWGNLLYHKTDTHWNVIGSYLGYCDIVRRLQLKLSDLKVLNIEQRDFSSVPSKQGGDLACMLNVAGAVDDPVISFKTNNQWSENLIKMNFDGDTLPVTFLQHIGAFEQCVIINPDRPYTLLLLKDSFSSWMVPYLNQTFGRVVYCHYAQTAGIELTKLVEKYKPDAVLYEVVERNIDLEAKAPSESLGDLP
jgi:alginate O-acetyltransferase complex protein AlgJ